jgi:hypothetical protein
MLKLHHDGRRVLCGPRISRLNTALRQWQREKSLRQWAKRTTTQGTIHIRAARHSTPISTHSTSINTSWPNAAISRSARSSRSALYGSHRRRRGHLHAYHHRRRRRGLLPRRHQHGAWYVAHLYPGRRGLPSTGHFQVRSHHTIHSDYCLVLDGGASWRVQVSKLGAVR